jgi:hypothetical protein
VKITIQVKAKDDEDAADYVRSIADQIEEGYASGYLNRHTHWTSSDEQIDVIEREFGGVWDWSIGAPE